MSSSVNCILQCENGGYCSLFPHTSEPITHSMVDGSLNEICICPFGWSGLTCSEPSESMDVCHHHDGNHVCRNGGLCKPPGNIYDDESSGKWRCDCKTADSVSGFAGAMCRDPATEYCTRDGSIYCTHGGTCWNNVLHADDISQRFGDCICPIEFGGPHCEFLKKLMDKSDTPHVIVTPKDSEGNGKSSHVDRGTGFDMGFALTLFLVIVVAMVAVYQKQKRERYRDRSQIPSMSPVGGSNIYEDHADRATFPVVMSGHYGQDEGSDNSDDGEFVMQNIVLT